MPPAGVNGSRTGAEGPVSPCGAPVQHKATAHQRGLALVAVMWMTAALALLAAALAATSRADLRAAANARAFAEAAALGDAAIQLAAVELRSGARPIERRTTARYEIEGRDVEVLVEPAVGFVDINRAPASLLQDLFLYGGGVDAPFAGVLAERVIDWRDSDQSPQAQGAEDDAYVAAGVRYRTRGGPFESPEDLLQVLGVGLDVYGKVGSLVTLHGSSRVDPRAAPPGVLRILARGDADYADRFAAARDAGQAAVDMTAFVQDHLQEIPGMRFRIEARIGDNDIGQLARVRWLNLGGGASARLPWRTLRVEPVRGVGPSLFPEDG